MLLEIFILKYFSTRNLTIFLKCPLVLTSVRNKITKIASGITAPCAGVLMSCFRNVYQLLLLTIPLIKSSSVLYLCLVTRSICRFPFTRLEGDTFFNKVRFYGVNFPPNGPVMEKRTLKWEASTEKMYWRDGVLTGDITMALLLKGNVHYRCDFRTTYK